MNDSQSERETVWWEPFYERGDNLQRHNRPNQEIPQSARLNVVRQVNAELLISFWNVGCIIVEHEQNSQGQAVYGCQTMYEQEKTSPADRKVPVRAVPVVHVRRDPAVGNACTDKDSVGAEYALGNLSNNIFASHLCDVIPNKEELIAQVEAVLKQWHEPTSEE